MEAGGGRNILKIDVKICPSRPPGVNLLSLLLASSYCILDKLSY